METTTHEIADGIHRISTFIPEVGIPFNQYLVVADEPLLFHTGHAPALPPRVRGRRPDHRPDERCGTSRSATSRPTSAAP